jgi:sigma-B regulation protein RsbU (phosphoserine phosphatase)
MLRHILQLTLDGLSADSGSIIVLNEKGDVSEVALAYAGEVQALDVQQFADIVERGLAGWVVAHRQAALVVDTKDDPRWLRRSWDNEGSSRSAISVPVLGDDRVTGVLTLVNSRAFQFKPEHLALLTAIAVSLSFIKVSTTR